jgi:hypothetical protein
MLSMMLYGAYFLLEAAEDEKLPMRADAIPRAAWARDGNGRTPFEAVLLEYVQGSGMCAESMLLLAARGCGSSQEATSAQARRIKAHELVKQLLASSNCFSGTASGGSGDGVPDFPQEDISMGAEPIKVPWVNETGDGITMKATWT